MRKRHIAPLVLLLAMSVLAGCLFDAVIDEKGGGTMTVKYRLTSEAQFRAAKRRFQSPHVTLVDADVDKEKWATFHVKFDDVTKLPSTEFFTKTTVTLIDDGAGNTTLTVKYSNPDTVQLLDELIEYFGNTVTMSVRLPGDIVKTNAAESSGNTAKWTFPLRDFSEKPGFVMSVTYKKAAAGAADTATSPVPTAGAADTATSPAPTAGAADTATSPAPTPVAAAPGSAEPAAVAP
jgi:hypothetical protein